MKYDKNIQNQPGAVRQYQLRIIIEFWYLFLKGEIESIVINHCENQIIVSTFFSDDKKIKEHSESECSVELQT